MTVRELIGDQVFEGVKDLLRQTFPDPRCAHDDSLVSAVVCALPDEARVAIGAAAVTADVAKALLERLTTPDRPDTRRAAATYFQVRATHTRPGVHEFVGVLPMARFALPETEQLDFLTDIGVVFAGDHHVYTRALVVQKYGEVIEALDYQLGDVYLTTPARYLGARFGAIAIYELFDKDGVRRGYILEAGMATGEPMMLYCSPGGGKITRKASYQPTPFSAPENYYTGEVSFTPAGPQELTVRVFTPDELAAHTPHVTIRAQFLPATPGPTFGSELTMEAALRVAAIAVARGSKDPIMLALAPFGRALHWNHKPGGTR